MNKLSRITGWINRFTIAIEHLGIVNAIKILILGRYTNKRRSITLPTGIPFKFESKLDQGVLSHFYREGHFIKDMECNRITNIVDAGANIGDETARFHIHYPNAKIVAIEAADRNFLLLEKNFHNIRNVELIRGAVWPVKANLQIVAASDSMESFKVTETQHELHDSIPAWSIEDILEKMRWDRIDILKLDIEGSEYELFTRNCSEWVGKVNAFIFEVPDVDRAGTTQAIYRALNGYNYNTYICGENLVLIKSCLPWKLQTVVGFNKS